MAVTSTNNLRQGSKGNDVLELQKKLNSTGYGYNLAEDGDFGSKTMAAVKDYQQRSGLTVDGIVGTHTWSALNNAQSSSSSASTPAETAPAEPKAPTFEYKPSDTVTQAEALLQQQMAQKPGAYQSTWKDQLNDTIAQILNRDKFSYDLNGDALYQQYADQYTTQGKLAMMDTMGQAAAMTGGYGNSYAQTAGQQAYQAYLQQLNDVVPELYGMALDQYNQEGQQLYDQAALMGQMEDQEYGRYQDQLSQYYTDLEYLTENARYMSETEYQKALDEFNIKYGSYWDQKNFDESVRQYDEQFAYQKEQDAIAAALAGGNNTSSAIKNTTKSAIDAMSNAFGTGGLSKEKIKQVQLGLGVEADGIWGPESKDAAGGLNAKEAYDKWINGEIGKSINQEIADGNKKAAMETKMYDYVKNMLNNARSSNFSPRDAIEANSNLSDEEKAVAIEILYAFVDAGYMR